MYFATFLAVAALAANGVSAAAVNMGCLSTLPLNVPLATSNTAAGCQANCAAGGWAYCFWNQRSVGCYGGSIPPGPAGMSSGNTASCATSLLGPANAWKMDTTTFSWETCATKFTPQVGDVPATSQPLNIETCFENCKKYRYAIAQAPSILAVTFTCTCLNQLPSYTGASTATCAASANYVYMHPAWAAASALARRKRAVSQKPIPSCPAPLSACLVSPDSVDGFECINPEYELESCGGCRFGHHGPHTANSTVGEDCTQLPGVHRGGVTCDFGKCLISHCRKGFKLVDGQCL